MYPSFNIKINDISIIESDKVNINDDNLSEKSGTVRKIIDKYRHFFEMSIFVYYGEILRKHVFRNRL